MTQIMTVMFWFVSQNYIRPTFFIYCHVDTDYCTWTRDSKLADSTPGRSAFR